MIDHIRTQIKKRRVEKQLTQSDVAVDLGITAGAYSKIESGPTAITVEKLAMIAAILEVEISYFFKSNYINSRVEEPANVYGNVTQSQLEELTQAVNKLKKEMILLKANLPKPSPVSKKKKDR